MITQIDSPFLIPSILALAQHIDDIPIQALEKMLTEGIADKNTKILVEKKEEDVRGFVFANIAEFQGEDVVFIQACYISPKTPNIGFELLKRLKDWAKEKDIKGLVMMTSRNPKSWTRKYGFKHALNIMKRRV